MLRVSHLRKLVKPTPCPDPPIALLGTEVGAPVSAGLPVDIQRGTVVATGAGYDFTNAGLRVTAAASCPESSELTFSITGTGPVPTLGVHSGYYKILLTVFREVAFADHKWVGPRPGDTAWALIYVPVTISAGAPYELKCSIADNWVGVWLNGTRVARAAVSPGALKTPYPWTVDIGRDIYSAPYNTYTGHVDSVRLANGALPDIDVL
jgi:hypothetical protein